MKAKRLMKQYTYKKGLATATITNMERYWQLSVSVPGKNIIVGNDIFPTKRGALIMAKKILSQYV